MCGDPKSSLWSVILTNRWVFWQLCRNTAWGYCCFVWLNYEFAITVVVFLCFLSVLVFRAYNCQQQKCPTELSDAVKSVYRKFNSVVASSFA
jgi:hypothetical protein